jgi:hypothetical protein
MQEAVLRHGSGDDASLFEIGRHLVAAGFGAGLVLIAARRTGNSDCPDGFVANHHGRRTLRWRDIGRAECASRRIALNVLSKFTGWNPLNAGSVGFPQRVFERARACVAPTNGDKYLAVTADDIG